MVPVSCPPCPASITIFPIFNPSARINDLSPCEVGAATCAVWSGDVFRDLTGGATVLNVGPLVGLLVALSFSSILGASSLAVSTGLVVGFSSGSTTLVLSGCSEVAFSGSSGLGGSLWVSSTASVLAGGVLALAFFLP